MKKQSKLREVVDKTEGFFIYKYVSSDGRIIYIGKSQSLLQRIKQHGSYAGIDEKFGKYEDADIFVHKCSSRHEMDALETLLIETYKPELNVSCKTDSPLSFSFCPEIEWVNFKEIEAEIKQAKEIEREKKQTGPEKTKRQKACGDKKPYNTYAIRSTKGQEKFQNAVADWHNLFYFFSWLSEQDDNDTRATIELNLEGNDVDEWVWNFREENGTFKNTGTVVLTSLDFKHGVTALVLSCQCEHGHIWIDLHDRVCNLKRIIPSMKADLNHRKKEISKYYIEDKFAEQCKADGFYDFYTKVNQAGSFPEYSVSEHELSESERLIYEDVVCGTSVEHTSPDIDWSEFSKEELWETFLSIGSRRTEYFRVGGKYWNVYGADKLSLHCA